MIKLNVKGKVLIFNSWKEAYYELFEMGPAFDGDTNHCTCTNEWVNGASSKKECLVDYIDMGAGELIKETGETNNAARI